jgi:hypothetical protein
MNSREHFEFIKKAIGDNYKKTAEDVVYDLVNELIDALYIPIKGERRNRVDEDRVKHFEVDRSEPINWGDLKCCEVKEFKDGTFLVTIDEASPGDCPSLCEYITTYMKSYGWEVQIETEW